MPNIVVIGLPNLGALQRALAKLAANQIPHYAWSEPDFDYGLTAIATAPINGEQRAALANYRVYTPKVLSTLPSKGRSVGENPTGCANGAGVEASARV